MDIYKYIGIANTKSGHVTGLYCVSTVRLFYLTVFSMNMKMLTECVLLSGADSVAEQFLFLKSVGQTQSINKWLSCQHLPRRIINVDTTHFCNWDQQNPVIFCLCFGIMELTIIWYSLFCWVKPTSSTEICNSFRFISWKVFCLHFIYKYMLCFHCMSKVDQIYM